MTTEHTKARTGPRLPAGGAVPAGTAPRRREHYWRSVAIVVVVAAALTAVITQTLPGYYVYTSVLVVLAGCGAVALNLLMGYAGQVSIGNAAFLAIGAFTAVGVAPYGGFLVGILAGAVASGLAGFIIGIPSLRLRGFYLVLSTLALQQIVSFGFEQVQGATNTPAGYTLDIAKIGSYEIQSDTDWLILAVCVLAIFLLVTSLLERSRTGRAWKAIREHEPAASVIGIDVARYKLLAFVISSAMIGVEGVLLAYYAGVVDYHTYTLDLAVSYAAMVLIGGLGTLYGPLLGAILVTVIPVVLKQIGSSGSGGSFLTKNSSSLNLLIYGVLIVVVLLAEPGGLAALAGRIRAVVTPRPRGKGER